MKIKDVDNWEIDGDVVHLEVDGEIVDTLYLDSLIENWLERNKQMVIK